MVAQMNKACVDIPDNITTLDAFCDWTASRDFPQHGRFSFIRGKIWMDLEMELLILHNLLKLDIAAVLRAISRAEKLGYVFTDRAFLKNAIVGLATEPDGLFVSFESIREFRAELIEGKGEGLMIVVGTPDMALEIVSSSSVRKDTVELRELYWQAGVAEYWLVDARQEPVKFDILKHGPKGYVATRKVGGWLKSEVFGRSFRITQQKDELGNPQFTLEVKK